MPLTETHRKTKHPRPLRTGGVSLQQPSGGGDRDRGRRPPPRAFRRSRSRWFWIAAILALIIVRLLTRGTVTDADGTDRHSASAIHSFRCRPLLATLKIATRCSAPVFSAPGSDRWPPQASSERTAR